MIGKRKLAILLGDGMADYPIESLGGKTPLEAARTPNMDYIAQKGITGMVKTIPHGMLPGSDTANLSVFGYNPEVYYTGRAPLEAINMGIDFGPDDAAFRCNIVNLNNNIMEDFSAGHIDSEFSKIVIKGLSEKINHRDLKLYPGVSYRNILIWHNYPYKDITETIPPHDIQDKDIDDYLPRGEGSDVLMKLMEQSKKTIAKSEEIKSAGAKYKGKPNSIWLWGGGKKPTMDSMEKRFGLNGYTISAVDLINGIGKSIGLIPLHVEGATGYIDTNYTGKGKALLDALKDSNFVFLHVESPDESGHEGNLEHKIKSIEDFDEKVVGQVLKGMDVFEDCTVIVLSDHPTPISIRTHTSDPVPFSIYRNKNFDNSPYIDMKASSYCEREAEKTGLFVKEGHRLIELMINGKL
ncbi:cofactor-independent phosphoglycerate mutase [Spirochaetota bacterium]